MKIHYITGSRADFGLMMKCLQAISDDEGHVLGIVITGQHTVGKYGETAREVRASGLDVVAEIPVNLSGQSEGAEMAMALAKEIEGFVDHWVLDRPDLVLVLGDRGEMLAATIAAVHLGIHVGHIHGGERSGTLDESFRHAISKMAHIHLVSGPDAARRLELMGERKDTIHDIGAPGLVGIADGICPNSHWLAREFGLDAAKPIALVLFHPVVQEADLAQEQAQIVIEATQRAGLTPLILRPNSDAGGDAVDRYLDRLQNRDNIAVVTHMDRQVYLRALASCDVLIGNSSSGILESASLGTPCVNVGSRQHGRLRNPNVIDVELVQAAAVQRGIEEALKLKGPFPNRYGDGQTHLHLLAVLAEISLDGKLLSKSNSY